MTRENQEPVYVIHFDIFFEQTVGERDLIKNSKMSMKFLNMTGHIGETENEKR